MAEETTDAAEPPKVSGVGAGNVGASTAMFGNRQRRQPGNGEKEAELERLNALRRRNNEARLQREREATFQQQKDVQLAEDYALRKRAIIEEQASARQALLAQQSQMSSKMSSRSPRSRIPLDDELAEDEEFRELFERYGDRLRVPHPPPPRPTRNRTQSPRKAAVPVQLQPRKPEAPSQNGVTTALAKEEEVVAAAARAAAPRRMSSSGQDVAASGISGHPGGRASASAGHGNTAAGRMSGSGAALPPISAATPRGVVNSEEQCVGNAVTEDEIPEPDRSLMPKKELLRKKQQALLKKTEVTFYKHQMNAHFQKILQAVEQTYTETNKKASQASLNLAKPSLEQANKHSSSRERQA